jgi:hypothetical protein
MKKITLLFTLICCIFITQSSFAQVTTKFGDNVSTLDGIMKAYYDVVTIKKGEKPSYERDSLLHWPNVNVGSVNISKTGKPVFHYISLKEFHRLSDPFLEKEG